MHLFSKVRRGYSSPPAQKDADLPGVTLIIAAYNEAPFIAQKIQNTLLLDYPEEKLEIVFVTDGSTDATPEIIKGFPRLRLFHESERRGKIHAVNRMMKLVTSPIVVFSDANTDLNTAAIRNIVRHYQDENVGGVAGEKKIKTQPEENAAGTGEGLYWKYESFLKRKDSEVYSVVGAAGELFSVRAALYEKPDENMIIEDFYLSLRIASQGYRFVYEPEAYALESASVSVVEEWKRKVRISAGAFQVMLRLKHLLNPFKHGILAFQYFSHRVLRWTLAPLFLPVVLFANIALAVYDDPVYKVLMAMQLVFYALALLGFVFRQREISIPGFFVPFYFCLMNLSVYAGFFRFFLGGQSVLWEKAQRRL